MGATFGSINFRIEDRQAVLSAVEALASECKKKFLVGPLLNGWISVYPEDSGLDSSLSAALAKLVSCAILHLVVYHDDIFYYVFYEQGKVVDEYSSRPDYFNQVPNEEMERLGPTGSSRGR